MIGSFKIISLGRELGYLGYRYLLALGDHKVNAEQLRASESVPRCDSTLSLNSILFACFKSDCSTRFCEKGEAKNLFFEIAPYTS